MYTKSQSKKVESNALYILLTSVKFAYRQYKLDLK